MPALPSRTLHERPCRSRRSPRGPSHRARRSGRPRQASTVRSGRRSDSFVRVRTTSSASPSRSSRCQRTDRRVPNRRCARVRSGARDPRIDPAAEPGEDPGPADARGGSRFCLVQEGDHPPPPRAAANVVQEDSSESRGRASCARPPGWNWMPKRRRRRSAMAAIRSRWARAITTNRAGPPGCRLRGSSRPAGAPGSGRTGARARGCPVRAGPYSRPGAGTTFPSSRCAMSCIP